MRKQKVVEVGGKKVTVRELTVEQILGLYEDPQGFEFLAAATLGHPRAMLRLLEMACEVPEGTTIQELCQGVNAYSELVAALREVNANFFKILPQELAAIRKMSEVVEASSRPSSGSRGTATRR